MSWFLKESVNEWIAMTNDTRRSRINWGYWIYRMYNHLEDIENVFVPAAHTFCSCVKATCRGKGREGCAVHTTAAAAVLVSPIGLPVLPTAAGLCVYCMYMMERCLWTRMHIARSSSFKSWCSLIRTTPGWPYCVHLHVWRKHIYFP